MFENPINLGLSFAAEFIPHLPAPSECEHGGDLPGNRIRHDYGAKLEPVGHVLHGAGQGSKLG